MDENLLMPAIVPPVQYDRTPVAEKTAREPRTEETPKPIKPGRRIWFVDKKAFCHKSCWGIYEYRCRDVERIRERKP